MTCRSVWKDIRKRNTRVFNRLQKEHSIEILFPKIKVRYISSMIKKRKVVPHLPEPCACFRRGRRWYATETTKWWASRGNAILRSRRRRPRSWRRPTCTSNQGSSIGSTDPQGTNLTWSLLPSPSAWEAWQAALARAVRFVSVKAMGVALVTNVGCSRWGGATCGVRADPRQPGSALCVLWWGFSSLFGVVC